MKWTFLILGVLALLFAGNVFGSHLFRFETDLSGANEVSPVETNTSGSSTFKYNSETSTIDFKVRVNDGVKVTMAHIHCAPAGQNGPVVVHLFGEVPGGYDVDGELADFTITDGNIAAAGAGCSPAITNAATLKDAMTQRAVYVNVHTVAHPAGEIRGQVEAD